MKNELKFPCFLLVLLFLNNAAIGQRFNLPVGFSDMNVQDEWGHENFAAEYSTSPSGPADIDFNGSYKGFWADGSLMVDGDYLPGFRKTGLHLVFWENGPIREVAFWREGFVVGTLLQFRHDGTLACERYFGTGNHPKWLHIERTYSEDQKLDAIYEVSLYETFRSWVNERTAEADKDVLAEAAMKNGGLDWSTELPALNAGHFLGPESAEKLRIPDGFVWELEHETELGPLMNSRYTGCHNLQDDLGNVRTELTFELGRLSGVQRAYWDNGETREVAVYKEGSPIATALRFRPDGSLREELFFGEALDTVDGYVFRRYNQASLLTEVGLHLGNKITKAWEESEEERDP